MSGRGHISVSRKTYERLRRHCEEQQISMSALVEALTADIGKDRDNDARK